MVLVVKPWQYSCCFPPRRNCFHRFFNDGWRKSPRIFVKRICRNRAQHLILVIFSSFSYMEHISYSCHVLEGCLIHSFPTSQSQSCQDLYDYEFGMTCNITPFTERNSNTASWWHILQPIPVVRVWSLPVSCDSGTSLPRSNFARVFAVDSARRRSKIAAGGMRR